jgi:hypothetical protein
MDVETIPLNEFALAWRWTGPTHASLPAEVLQNIQALSPSSARALAEHAVEICSHDSYTLQCSTPDSFTSFLSGLPIPEQQNVYVSWDQETAVIAPWSLVREFWDDFCYPASDDVSIWPLKGSWSLCYHHDDVLAFAVAPHAKETS